MAARGPYRKGIEKRAEILNTALEVINRNGYSNATVKELADAVGLSQNGLLHYFGSKDNLFMEILRHRDELLAATINHEPQELQRSFTERVVEAAGASASSPGLLELTLRLSADATEPDHPAHSFFGARYESIREVIGATLQLLKESDRLPEDTDVDLAAALIQAATEGLLVQWFYDKSMDVDAHLRYLLRSIGIPEDIAGAIAAAARRTEQGATNIA
ncbi:TetR/AcrR family transcriptional regulator [Paenarthrobacter sp. AB444]|uniref:TetR/AcrR family transcriptional regulator n=1 Tax=Paenarthrobacter sp. AB444 TaxID=3025681 RepID=UPI0023661E04|nr:TetR/AcrR family transcriptional regulator [Paenarthrobacter sp. AB444]MDD7833891.1 TetR/AcrR family transcriptional regulator [Paenarthrobacter sp. AB444]